MRAYRVGGSVRDELLGLPVADRDWVVIGATPQQMIDRGFRPVGKDFPVFLHPDSKEEYALARTERKTGPGYKGFAVHFEPGVTLEEDLARRDLTINAIAQADDGSLIDPFDGRGDLQNRVLRHVSESFAEDPVRILRLARFAARFPDFRIAPETIVLTQRMTAAGEVDALVAERVWQELARGLQEVRPSRMVEVLFETGALAVLLPELAPPAGGTRGRTGSGTRPGAGSGGSGGSGGSSDWERWLAALDRCARRSEPLPVCYAVLMSQARSGAPQAPADAADAAVLQVSQRLRVPGDCRDLGALLAREGAAASLGGESSLLEAIAAMPPPDLLKLLDRCDAWRRPERLGALVHAAAAIADADPASDPGALRLQRALRAANRVDQAAIARRLRGTPNEIRDAIDRERLVLIAAAG